MRIRLAGLVIAPGLLAMGCSAAAGPDGEGGETPPADAINLETTDLKGEDLAAVVRMDTSKSDPVPASLLGTWVYSHDECDEELLADIDDGEVEKRDIRAQISFAEDRTYGMDVEGFPFSGSYRYEGGEHPRLTLDNWLNFNVVGDTLQNWSEGDAVYLCGRVFVRDK